MEDKLKKDIEAIVAKIFSEKEEAAKMQATGDALNDAASRIATLDANIEAKAAKIDELTTSLADTVADKDAKLAETSSLLEKAEADKNSALEKLAEVEAEFANLKKDILVKERLIELSEAKVAIKDVDSQVAKIKDMNDEEFSAYKKDRVELRKSVMKELEAASNAPAAAGTTPPEEEVVEDAGVVTPQAVIKPDMSATAAMNFESGVGTVSKKYAELGKAMAASIKSGKLS